MKRTALVPVLVFAILALMEVSTVTAQNKDEPKVVTTQSGLKYQEVKEGVGEAAKANDVVEVHYTGWLKSGKKFDSSLDRNKPIVFKLGVGDVIKGWDEGLQGMKTGGKRKLMIPSELAYGKQGRGDVIPPNSELIFDVELVKIRK